METLVSVSQTDITVRPVRTRRDRKRFIDLSYRLYKDNPFWVPPLRLDLGHTLNPKKNPFFEHGTMQLFLAEDTSGAVVGRIAGIVNGMHLKRYEDGNGFFGFFECEERYDTAAALFDTAAAWLREQGLTGMRGPANPTLNDIAGLLVDGFDRTPCLRPTWTPYSTLSAASGANMACSTTALFDFREGRGREGVLMANGKW